MRSLFTKSGCGSYTSGDDRNTIFKNPQVRVLGRSRFYNNMVTQKGNAREPRKMTSSRDHRYNKTEPSTDHEEGASLIK